MLSVYGGMHNRDRLLARPESGVLSYTPSSMLVVVVVVSPLSMPMEGPSLRGVLA